MLPKQMASGKRLEAHKYIDNELSILVKKERVCALVFCFISFPPQISKPSSFITFPEEAIKGGKDGMEREKTPF